jgi:hypothetical protein
MFCEMFLFSVVTFYEPDFTFFVNVFTANRYLVAYKHLDVNRPISPMYLSVKGYVKHTFLRLFIGGFAFPGVPRTHPK